ncbi:MFS transporter [Nakamurella lactea]|uniref:MFS transporter n=1 Tax=Nakamurella lactea TaxID=459515 RepID=UPI00040EBD7A|nr:MFS transporter [Nakamurella lactea]
MTTTTSLATPGSRPLTATQNTLSTAGLYTALSALLMSVLSFSATSVALHDIGTALHASPASLSLVMSAYSVGFAMLMVIGGRLGDLYGRRRLFLIGMAGFTVTSLLATFAPDVGVLIAARALMGFAAAMMVPQVLATFTATTSGKARAKAVGLFGATAGGGTALGQVLGGVVLSADVLDSGWRGVFAIGVPIGALAFVAALRWMPETTAPGHRHLDLRGTALLGAALLALLVPLAEGGSLHWPWWTWALMAASVVLAGWFWRTQKSLHGKGTVPLVPPPLMRLRTFRLGLLMAVILMAGYGAFTFEYTLLTQTGLGWSPMHAALVTVPFALVFLIVSIVAGNLVPRFGSRRILLIGAIVQSLGLIGIASTALAEGGSLDSVSLAGSLVGMGLGQAMMLGPLVGVVLAEVPVASAGAGSGVFTTTQQASLALGVAALGAVFTTIVGDGRDAPDAARYSTAFAVCLLIQALGAVLFAVAAARLPRLQR